MATEIASDKMALEIECSYSNIGKEWTAEAVTQAWEAGYKRSITVAVGKGKTRPEALRELADALEEAAPPILKVEPRKAQPARKRKGR